MALIPNRPDHLASYNPPPPPTHTPNDKDATDYRLVIYRDYSFSRVGGGLGFCTREGIRQYLRDNNFKSLGLSPIPKNYSVNLKHRQIDSMLLTYRIHTLKAQQGLSFFGGA